MIKKIRFQLSRKPKLHFLHIGKTGGSAVKSCITPYRLSGKYKIVFHDHSVSLVDIPDGEKIFFFLRDPISRFISGFYSRQRKGLPRYHSKWSDEEELAFTRFTKVNELAMALSEKESENHTLAVEAMESIQHLNHYAHWFKNLESFKNRQEDILYIGFQETLDENFEELKSLLELPKSLSLPKDEVSAHKNPENIDKRLEANAISALNNWYRDDFDFYEYCKKLKGREIC